MKEVAIDFERSVSTVIKVSIDLKRLSILFDCLH